MDKELAYTGFARKRGYKRYRAQTSDCRSCPLRKQCIGTSAQGRLIERHLHEEAIQKQKEITGTPKYYAAMRLRKIWCEGNFSHQKERHNLKRTRKRGIEKVTEQCLLSACALNLKRLVKYLGGRSLPFDYTVIESVSPLEDRLLLWFIGRLSTAPKRAPLSSHSV